MDQHNSNYGGPLGPRQTGGLLQRRRASTRLDWYAASMHTRAQSGRSMLEPTRIQKKDLKALSKCGDLFPRKQHSACGAEGRK
eukprot:4256104-Pleurochrysis_carterae.AAC.1